MQAVSNRTVEDAVVAREMRLADVGLTLSLLVVTALLFGVLFNRESVLSYAIGYNLYGAERVLEGEVPYRDFHTLYPPATVYINAAIFKMLGVSLYNALVGVLVFKVLTTAALFLCGRLIMPRGWALGAAAFSLLWLRPNGPFKAVPMHYGSLFLATGLLFLLSYLRRRKNALLFAAGISLGVLALFKHNIGAYALIGSLVAVVVADVQARPGLGDLIKHWRAPLVLLCGCVLPLVPVLVYMKSEGALGSMIRTLLFGPGEFLLGRLNAFPSPVIPVILVVWVGGCWWMLSKLKSRTSLRLPIIVGAVMSIFTFLVVADQRVIDPVIFYAPVIVIIAGAAACVFGGEKLAGNRAALIAVLACAAAAFMESFPRFAREQAVSSMPFVVLLLFYLLYGFRPAVKETAGGGLRLTLALSVLPLAFVLMGGRLFVNTYFDGFRFKSARELNTERGRGVYFPEAVAREIDEVVGYIHDRVPPGGYFFAHSYAGSSYLFLADRNNPSGAQFWGGIGVSDDEKSRTLASIKEKDVRLIVTSEKDLTAEKYEPMREYVSEEFHFSKRIGDVVILER